MSKVFINFADNNFQKEQLYAVKKAKRYGNFDQIIAYSPADLESEFVKKYHRHFSIKRGFGLWLWKPYLIYKTLLDCQDGDYVFYLDSGCYIRKKIDFLIRDLENIDQDIMPFEGCVIEEQWTKPSLFVATDCNSDAFKKTRQFGAGYILIKNSRRSRKFIKEWLDWCKHYEYLTHEEIIGVDFVKNRNFIENRHDQSTFSLLCKKHHLKGFLSPAAPGNYNCAWVMVKKIAQVYDRQVFFDFKTFQNSRYPQLIHEQKRVFPFVIDICFSILKILPFNSRLYELMTQLALSFFVGKKKFVSG